jgi:hypothetical protein
MKTKITLFVAVALTAPLLSQPMFAVPTTYVYTGNPFTFAVSPYTTSDRVTGTVELASPLPPNFDLATVSPLAFSFSDGVQTITSATVGEVGVFKFHTDSTGSITEWEVSLMANTADTINTIANPALPPPLLTFFDEGDLLSGFLGTGFNRSQPGAWKVASGVPDSASTLALLSLSLTTLGVAARRSKRAAA